MIAELTSFTNDVEYSAFAGIMMRDSASPGDLFADVGYSPGWGGVWMIWRTTVNGTDSNSSAVYTSAPSSSSPIWLKLVQSGTTVTGYESANGVTWTQVDAVSVALNSSYLAGMAVTSEYSEPLVTAGFSKVSVSATVDDSSPLIAYTPGWWTASNSNDYDGSAHATTDPGNTVSFTFTGTSVSWIGSVGPDHGMVEVFIDGVFVETVDAYAATANYQQTLFTDSGLSYGTHTIELVVSSDDDPLSTGFYVDVDAFLYSGNG
jgi:hypothetical protein